MAFKENFLQSNSPVAVVVDIIPPATERFSVSIRQMRLALIEKRKVTAFNDAIKAIVDSTEKAKIQVEWDYGTVIYRDSAWFQTLMDGIEYSEADVDDLFATAASL